MPCSLKQSRRRKISELTFICLCITMTSCQYVTKNDLSTNLFKWCEFDIIFYRAVWWYIEFFVTLSTEGILGFDCQAAVFSILHLFHSHFNTFYYILVSTWREVNNTCMNIEVIFTYNMLLNTSKWTSWVKNSKLTFCFFLTVCSFSSIYLFFFFWNRTLLSISLMKSWQSGEMLIFFEKKLAL